MGIPNTSYLPASHVAYTIDPKRPVLTQRRTMNPEEAIAPHRHPRRQLLWSSKGLLRVTTNNAVWVVPSSHAVWIPGNAFHQVTCQTQAQIRNLYFDPSCPIRHYDSEVVMLAMSPLMREIIVRMTREDLPDEPFMQRLGLVALDELESLEPFFLHLPSGQDPRLLQVINQLILHPKESVTLDILSRESGASTRTIERLFKSETGYTFRQWRSRFRLMNSLEAINKGENTKTVAYELGYKSVSSFIAEFKKLYGAAPQEYASQFLNR
ncbi:AraC family transcriptional regulator [Vibrio sp. WJH972]